MGVIKSVSRRSRNADDLIEDSFVRTTTTKGHDFPTPIRKVTPMGGTRRMKSGAQTQERPPPSIFKTHPTILICGYLHSFLSQPITIPKSIQNLCLQYYSEPHESLLIDSLNPSEACYYITNIDDHTFQNIRLKHDTKILGIAPIIKLSSLSNLEFDWNSSISIDQSNDWNGTIVLTVFGDINMGKNTKLLCQGNGGRIYIQVNDR